MKSPDSAEYAGVVQHGSRTPRHNAYRTDRTDPVGLVVLATDARMRLRRGRRRRYRGKTRLWRTVDAALASNCRPIIVVLEPRDTMLRDEIAIANEPGRLKVVINWSCREGASSSIRQGVTNLQDSPRHVEAATFVRARRTPNAGAIRELVSTYDSGRMPVVASRRADPAQPAVDAPVLFHRSLFGDLLRLHGEQGLTRVIHRHPCRSRRARPEPARRSPEWQPATAIDREQAHNRRGRVALNRPM